VTDPVREPCLPREEEGAGASYIRANADRPLLWVRLSWSDRSCRFGDVVVVVAGLMDVVSFLVEVVVPVVVEVAVGFDGA